MFSKHKNIIFISRSRLRAATVVLGRAESVRVIEDAAWSKERLLPMLSDIHAKIGSDIRIVLGEDLGYVVSFSSKNIAKHDRLAIKHEVQGFIPENLDEVAWDFQCIAAIVGDKRIGVSKGVQVAAVSKVFLHDIVPVFVEAGFVVDALETESCALARLMHKEDEPMLIVHTEHGRSLMVVLERGVVMATESFSAPATFDHIEKLVALMQKQFTLHISSIIFSEEAAKTLADVRTALQGKGFSVRELPLDPIVGTARKIDISGDDARVLNVNILPEEKKKVLGVSLSSREKRLLVLFVTAFVFGSFFVAGIFLFRKSSYMQAPQASQISPQPIPQASVVDVSGNEEVILPQSDLAFVQSMSEYAIRILNGSGRRGEAAGIEKSVRAQGAKTVSIGNADAYSAKTTIRTKESVSVSLIQMISQTVLSEYSVDDIGKLDDDAEDDIMIIIGGQKNE